MIKNACLCSQNARAVASTEGAVIPGMASRLKTGSLSSAVSAWRTAVNCAASNSGAVNGGGATLAVSAEVLKAAG